MSDPLANWPAFAESVRKRLEAGRAAYGDKSFARPPTELIGELQQEALDLAGWGFVLWCRLETMRAELARPARLVGELAYDLSGVPLSALPPQMRAAFYPNGSPITPGSKNET